MKIWVDLRSTRAGMTPEQVQEKASMVLRELDLEEPELSLLLVDDPEMAKLNLKFLGRKGPTNVIAFSQLEGQGPRGPSVLLGDVVISLETCQREAQEAGMEFQERFMELLVHGILHLLGHEHEDDPQGAALMESEAQRILARIMHQ
ncbi:MAG: rRNA maturation RNase YbeY [bacterium]